LTGSNTSDAFKTLIKLIEERIVKKSMKDDDVYLDSPFHQETVIFEEDRRVKVNPSTSGGCGG
ncbi:hypothetical protein ADUPG1_010984, partial [Aduncisulcus paluster]